MSSAPVILPDLCPVEVVETKFDTETKSKVETRVETKVETEVETIDQVDQIEIEESIEKLENIDENDLQKAGAKDNTATKMVQVRNIGS